MEGPKIIRIKKGTRGFTRIDNSIFYHPALKLECKGLMGLFLSFPDNWEVRVTHLTEILPEGRDAIYSTMKKLIQYGFLERKQERYANGRVGPVIYYVHERSLFEEGSIPLPGKPFAVKSPLTKTNSNKAVNNCSDVKNESEDLFEVAPAELEAEEREEVVSEIQSEVLAEPEEGGAVALKADEPSEPESRIEPVEPEAAVEGPKAVDCVPLFPCHDAVPKQASLLKHCLTVERKVEVALGKKLTEAQQSVVKDVANYFSVPHGERELADWISEALMSPRSFSRCKTFVHKLNAIISKIRAKEFTRPRVFKASISAKAHQAIAACLSASNAPSRIQILQTEIKAVQLKISSSRAAEAQFQAYTDVAQHHKSATESYLQALHGLRQELNQYTEGVHHA